LDILFQGAAVLNPGAAEQGNEVVFLLRIEDDAGFSNLHMARSKNGVTDWKVNPKPILAYGEPEWQY
jgi:predicted GH43/DUF377 family glycosyl hydrolase